MIAAQHGDPHIRLLEEILQIAIDDIRYQEPTACPKYQRDRVKKSAEDLLHTKFYTELCDLFNIPAARARKMIFSQKNKFLKKEIKDELPELQNEVEDN